VDPPLLVVSDSAEALDPDAAASSSLPGATLELPCPQPGAAIVDSSAVPSQLRIDARTRSV
jgi:hypothetical protein